LTYSVDVSLILDDLFLEPLLLEVGHPLLERRSLKLSNALLNRVDHQLSLKGSLLVTLLKFLLKQSSTSEPLLTDLLVGPGEFTGYATREHRQALEERVDPLLCLLFGDLQIEE